MSGHVGRDCRCFVGGCIGAVAVGEYIEVVVVVGEYIGVVVVVGGYIGVVGTEVEECIVVGWFGDVESKLRERLRRWKRWIDVVS